MATANTHRLAHVGPLDPDHGFPMFYEDETGTRLELAVDDDPFAPAVGERPDPGQPVHFPDNFPDEAFYFLAESEMAIGGAGVVGRARLILALEAAFGGAGAPSPGHHVVFARIRVRMDDVIPGAQYVVTHPYGVTDPLTADDRGRVFVTEDLGVADEDVTAVLADGQVAPFLRWASPPPVGHLGDGVSERAVTGSPFGTDFFRVDGPSVADAGGPRDPADPANADRIQNPLFTVQGQLARRHGVDVTGATYTRAGGAVHVDVHATSVAGQALELAGAGVPRVAFAGAGRDYAARAAVTAVPVVIAVVNTTDVPVTRVVAAVSDLVTVQEAVHDLVAQTLTVSARSSDDTGPALTVEEFGPLTAVPTVFTGVAATPAEVTVTSAAGGRAGARVVLSGPDLPELGVLADAGPDLSAVTGTTVTLDGSGSRGDVTAFAWTQTAGPPVALSDPADPAPTFTAPAAGAALTFSLTVQGPGGPEQDDVAVLVTAAPPPDQITVDRAQFRTGSRQYRVGGTVVGALPNQVVVSFDGAELGRSPVDAVGAWDVRRTLAAAETGLVPDVGDVVNAASATGGPVAAPLTVRS